MIRVIKGKDRERTKPIGTRWSGVEIVVMNQVDELFEKLKDHPSFDVLSEPTTFDFSDVGANIHRGFHGKGPGKTHLMFTMEVTKPTGGYDFPSAEGIVGHIFSVPLVSTTYKASLEFYRDDIHMIPVLTDHLEDGLWHQEAKHWLSPFAVLLPSGLFPVSPLSVSQIVSLNTRPRLHPHRRSLQNPPLTRAF